MAVVSRFLKCLHIAVLSLSLGFGGIFSKLNRMPRGKKNRQAIAAGGAMGLALRHGRVLPTIRLQQ